MQVFASLGLKTWIQWVALVAILFQVATASVPLTDENYQTEVKNGQWFIKFYSPTCPACKRIAPMWDGMAKKIEEKANQVNIHIGEVNCKKYLNLCKDVKDFPTLRFYVNGENKDEVNYSGTTTEASLLDFVDARIADAEKEVDAENAEAQKKVSEDATTSDPSFTTSTSSLSLGFVSGTSTNPHTDFTDLKMVQVSPKTSSISPISSSLPSSSFTVAQSTGIPKENHSKASSTSPISTVSAPMSAEEKFTATSVSASSTTSQATYAIQTAPNVPDEGGDLSEPVNEDSEKAAQPNPTGHSKPLVTQEDIDNALSSETGWFVHFYSSECTDSAVTTATTAWNAMAGRMKNKLNVGHLDCSKHKPSCNKYNIQHYPSSIFFKENEYVEYNGLFKVGDLTSFAEEAANFKIREVEFFDTTESEKHGDVFFLYFYDDKSADTLSAVRKTAIQLLGHARLYLTKSQQLVKKYNVNSLPKLIVVKDSTPSYYPTSVASDITDYRRILNWMKNNWLPVLPELQTFNSDEIANTDTVVLYFLDPDSSNFQETKSTARKIASDWLNEESRNYQTAWKEETDKKNAHLNKAEEKNDAEALEAARNMNVKHKPAPTRFAWVNGNYWAKWSNKFNLDINNTGPRVILYNPSKGIYWDTNAKGEAITVDEDVVFEVLKDVEANPNALKPKKLKENAGLEYLASYGLDTRALYLICGVVCVGIIVSLFGARRIRSLERRHRSSPILPIATKNTGNTGKFD
ncbi:ER associated protein disulfide isomerase Pdi2 [Schizosaccharomyces cryophilus OY26]|uniref:ER associated protein disulfide isomerase Pdi2 n=1 Tax=Schizosaccharomyces cryophilus (strain OY26 / ATCC MYA-4695 / CBS 11777 / NBRC 106824 / NRRL Y48691) TaxID=653667 RepID=S9WX38_SCHCR|nr:ER associated protein disulfide isomerase Pdi2 [Schizosaccharomyces cryophilus OY26]EPY49302.1 ER associated protein disulfide isomerase Pdi2 [Schizosaccharomyces cryophilus OY26]